MLFSSLFLPSLLSTQNIIWYLPSKKGSTVVVRISDEIVLYPFSKEDEAMAPSAEAWKQNMCVVAAAASVFCFFLPPEKMALVWHVAKIWKSQYCCLVLLAACFHCCSNACHYWSVERRHMRDIYDTICISKIIHLLGKGSWRQPTP